VDIAKTNHVASLLDSEGNVVVKAIKFTNSKEGFEKLLSSLDSVVTDYSKILISMEATGIYWLALFSALIEKDFNVSVFNPYQIKAYRGAYNNRKQKNDIIDSIIIADYLRVFGGKESNLPKDDVLSLRDLARFRATIINDIGTQKVRVINLLDKIFPEYKSAFSDVFGTTSKQILLECPTPESILKINTLKLSNLLSKNSRGRLTKATAKSLKDLAKNSFGIKITSESTSFAIKQSINQIIFLEEQASVVQEKILEIYFKLDSHLLSVPGIGKTLAPLIFAEIGDIERFSSPSKLTAFAGIDPSQNQSGNKLSTNEKTSKRGSPYLRHAIYTAAFVAISNDPVLGEYYYKKKAEGKHHFVALAGVQRKLLHIIYYVLKEQRDYRKSLIK
jgi:transposase